MKNTNWHTARVRPINTRDIDLHYRGFLVKYLGPSALKGARFRIHDVRHNKRKTLTLRDDLPGHSPDQAATYLESIGIAICGLLCADWLPGGNMEVVLLSKDFATPLT